MKTSKSAASSRRGKLVVKSEQDIRDYIKSPEFKKAAERSKAMGPDPSAADLKEIPELTDEELSRMTRKSPINVRVDGDVLAWLKSKPGKYQQHLNAALRLQMMREKARGNSKA